MESHTLCSITFGFTELFSFRILYKNILGKLSSPPFFIFYLCISFLLILSHVL